MGIGEALRVQGDKAETTDWGNSLSGNVPDFELYFPDLTVDVVNIRADKLIWDQGSTAIFGHVDMGIFGTARFGSSVDDGSILRLAESRMYQEYNEDFVDTASQDSSLTNAFWSNTGSLSFGAGSDLFDIEAEFATGNATTGIGSGGGSLALL